MTTATFFTSSQIENIDHTRIPSHVAIIPDGNRRWAKQKNEQAKQGHFQGANRLIEITKAAKELGIKTITFYLFSTENWNRSKEEISVLMWLLQEFLKEHRSEMLSAGVRFCAIGDLKVLPKEILDSLEETRQATEHCNCINMVVALNYGSRNEIKRTFHKIIDDFQSGNVQKEQITEELIAKYLDTAAWGDPDLFIRTSGEKRLSNYMLWQLAYTEVYFTEVLWPDFKPSNLLDAIADFQKRERRWGGA